MTRYRLPDVLGGGEFEATEWWSGCAGADRQYRIAGTNVTISVPSQSPLEEIPPLLPQPPTGSVVLDRYGYAWQLSSGDDDWHTWTGDGHRSWAGLVELLGPVTRLVPEATS